MKSTKYSLSFYVADNYEKDKNGGTLRGGEVIIMDNSTRDVVWFFGFQKIQNSEVKEIKELARAILNNLNKRIPLSRKMLLRLFRYRVGG